MTLLTTLTSSKKKNKKKRRNKNKKKKKEKKKKGMCTRMYRYSRIRRRVTGLVFVDVSRALVAFVFKFCWALKTKALRPLCTGLFTQRYRVTSQKTLVLLIPL